MKCTIAANEMERAAIVRQRYEIFVEEFNFFEPGNDAKRIESDLYDDYALLFGVWEKESLIASCRLVLPNTAVGLPTLNTMVIDQEIFQHDRPTAEISRITVAAHHRTFKQTIKVLQSMQREISLVSDDYGIQQWIGAVEPAFLRLLHQSHLPYRPIGPLQFKIGAERYPVCLESQDYTTSIKECP